MRDRPNDHTQIHALFVDLKGPYPRLGVDCWGRSRNAFTFNAAGPVIVHPPCGRWGAMARLNQQRWGAKVGDDGGCFAFALSVLRRNGGVLEHPARSLAWNTFALPYPHKTAWNAAQNNTWVCEVWQSAYGHSCHKRTWLLYVGAQPPFELDWRRDRALATHQVGGGVHTGNRSKPRLAQKLTHLSPPLFAAALVQLAAHSDRVSYA